MLATTAVSSPRLKSEGKVVHVVWSPQRTWPGHVVYTDAQDPISLLGCKRIQADFKGSVVAHVPLKDLFKGYVGVRSGSST